jgi:hypothetical protein
MKQGEIWLINLDPAIGAEIKKTRPAIGLGSIYHSISAIYKSFF